MDELVLTGIAVYPLKSGAGIDLDESVVDPRGLRGDRRWMAIDPGGAGVTARERPRMVRIRARSTGAGIGWPRVLWWPLHLPSGEGDRERIRFFPPSAAGGE